MKYELSKASGHLRLDRPQRFSSFPPTLYGFIPQTYCGEEVAALCETRTGATSGTIRGDGDPLDVCVLTEKAFTHGNFFIRAKPVGGLRMIDGLEADDKIIAVLDNDVAFGTWAPRRRAEGLMIAPTLLSHLQATAPNRRAASRSSLL